MDFRIRGVIQQDRSSWHRLTTQALRKTVWDLWRLRATCDWAILMTTPKKWARHLKLVIAASKSRTSELWSSRPPSYKANSPNAKAATPSTLVSETDKVRIVSASVRVLSMLPHCRVTLTRHSSCRTLLSCSTSSSRRSMATGRGTPSQVSALKTSPRGPENERLLLKWCKRQPTCGR